MNSVPLAEVKARLSELVQRAIAGEPTQITLRGRPVVQITALERPKKPIDVDALRRLTHGMTLQEEPSGEFIRRMRDEERY